MGSDPSSSSDESSISEHRRENGREPQKPWDQRPWPASGDEDVSATYQAVGLALTEWARYEAALGRLFEAFVALDRSHHAARRGFESVRTFEGRIEILRATGGAYFATFPEVHMIALFKEIKTYAKNFAPRRNEIAHSEARRFPASQPFNEDGSGKFNGFCLMPSFFDPKKTNLWGWPIFAYGSAELDHYAKEFSKLGEAPQILSVQIVERAQSLRGKPL